MTSDLARGWARYTWLLAGTANLAPATGQTSKDDGAPLAFLAFLAILLRKFGADMRQTYAALTRRRLLCG